MACDLTCAKGIILVGIFLMSALGVALPLYQWGESKFTLGNLFSGGVLVSASLVHFLDDAVDSVSDAIDNGSLPDFPWAQCLMGAGYLFMFTVESAVVKFVDGRSEEGLMISSPTADHDWKKNEAIERWKQNEESLATSLVDSDQNIVTQIPVEGERLSQGSLGSPTNRPRLNIRRSGSLGLQRSNSNSSFISATGSMSPSAVGRIDPNRAASVCQVVAEDAVIEMFSTDIAAGYAAFMALTIHSVIEGIGLGTQNDTDGLIAIASAIIFHKGFAAFAMGCALAKIGNRRIYFTLCAIFCLASPVGMAVGMAVEMQEPDGPAPGLLNAFCGGTLLFVATEEIITPALASPSASWCTKQMALWIGFAAMSVVAIWV